MFLNACRGVVVCTGQPVEVYKYLNACRNVGLCTGHPVED